MKKLVHITKTDIHLMFETNTAAYHLLNAVTIKSQRTFIPRNEGSLCKTFLPEAKLQGNKKYHCQSFQLLSP